MFPREARERPGGWRARAGPSPAPGREATPTHLRCRLADAFSPRDVTRRVARARMRRSVSLAEGGHESRRTSTRWIFRGQTCRGRSGYGRHGEALVRSDLTRQTYPRSLAKRDPAALRTSASAIRELPHIGCLRPGQHARHSESPGSVRADRRVAGWRRDPMSWISSRRARGMTTSRRVVREGPAGGPGSSGIRPRSLTD